MWGLWGLGVRVWGFVHERASGLGFGVDRASGEESRVAVPAAPDTKSSELFIILAVLSHAPKP